MTLEQQTAEDFLKIAPKFKLGCLLTEQPNPITQGLSEMAKNDLPKAIEAIKKLDINTITILKQKIPQLQQLYVDINQTLQKGGRVFVCGCGATGRLSLVLETLWRQQCKQIYPQWSEKVVSFMAGGDAALIKSVEDFEDHPEFAQKHLMQLGFNQNDILVGSTEGGETPWVIGAVWKATQISNKKPYILYGNTDQILSKNVERSREFIQSDKIIKINCNIGNMALAGSTRMQSTTILMHAIGVALLGCDRLRKIKHPQFQNWRQYAENNVETFLKFVSETDFSVIAKLIEEETQIYKRNQQITYITDPDYAISILTDTTERSPTFSLLAFKNKYTDPSDHKCWCNLKIINPKSQNVQSWQEKVQSDWQTMLGDRKIRALSSQYWNKYKGKVSHEVLLGFGMHEITKNTLTISHPPLTFKSEHSNISFPKYPLSCRLSEHSLLKIILNNLSTLIMGRMDRYQSNIMTYVRPTNYKLIDRATRYIIKLRPQYSYEEVVRAVYEIKATLPSSQPIVLKVIQVLDSRKNK